MRVAPPDEVRRARVATSAIFLVVGSVFGGWVSRVPDIKAHVHADSGPFGLALLGIAVGAVAARPFAAVFVARHGSLTVTRLTAVVCCFSLIAPSLAVDAVTLGCALALMGAALGSVDIAMNAHAVAVERLYGRPVMSSFHGLYSIGGLLGALAGGGAAVSGLSPSAHFTTAAVLTGGTALLVSTWLLPSPPDDPSAGHRRRKGLTLPRADRLPLILLGIIGFCSLAAEGAVGDWGSIYLHEDLGSSVGQASLGFVVYSLAMVAGRLLGGRVLEHWGEWRVITWMTALAGTGFLLALLAAHTLAALAGLLVMGLGLSLVLPVVLSRAGELGRGSEGLGIAVVSSISGMGPIVVPPVIGFLAEGVGLPASLGTLSALALVAVVLMQVVRRLGPAPPHQHDSPVSDARPEGPAVSSLIPVDPVVLSTAVVTTLAVEFDPQAREASIFYWERSLPHRRAVVEAAERIQDTAVSGLVRALRDAPADPAVHRSLRERLAELSRAGGEPGIDDLFTHAWRAESNSRLGYHLGPGYDGSRPGGDITAERLSGRPSGAVAGGGDAEILVVVPFRDRGTGRRLRNLLACLMSLRDQSAPRASYRVMVVETDETPRSRAVVTPYTDHYLFAHKTGHFNKSWAVNVGVVNAPVRPEAVCILDADVLADRDFIARNAERFRHSGTMGHLSYRDMWCLDEASTSRAITERLWEGAPEADAGHLRAFVLRRPPGCCVWVRTSAFHRIGGMDERFEGWGGEDNDFAYRMDTHSAFDHYDDPLLHMYHPSSAVLREDGELLNAHIPALTWKASSAIGDLNRFAAPKDAGPVADAEEQPAGTPAG
ncbi:MFS transporter [Streptomyces sp. NPDC058463]|uniref:MFS transporter n=1 Tax=Streptomyces sp. NPDC058463 TaxID=3346510 RepID=UPI0036683BF5